MAHNGWLVLPRRWFVCAAAIAYDICFNRRRQPMGVEIGLFGWMASMAFVFFPAPHHLMTTSAAYWFLMQIGMIMGFFTSWPANVWLVNRGIKVSM